MKVRVNWEVEPSRNLFDTRVMVEDFVGMDRSDAGELLTRILQEDFEQSVYWSCPKFDEAVTEILERAAELKDEAAT